MAFEWQRVIDFRIAAMKDNIFNYFFFKDF